MEARNVKIYLELSKKNYKFYNDSAKNIDLSVFLNGQVDEETNDLLIEYNQIRAVYNNDFVKDYKVVFTFINGKNNLNYLIYTNNTYDQQNKLMLFALIYDEDLPNPFIGHPNTDDEWIDIYSLTDSILLEH